MPDEDGSKNFYKGGFMTEDDVTKIISGVEAIVLKQIDKLNNQEKIELWEDALRWRFYADSPQTALSLGTNLDPNHQTNWKLECDKLADWIMYNKTRKELRKL